jgi:hypothetical protein
MSILHFYTTIKMYFDLWISIANYCQTEERVNLSQVSKSAYEAINHCEPLPRQISIMLENSSNRFSKQFPTTQSWVNYFSKLKRCQLYEPFYKAWEKKNYKFVYIIVYAKSNEKSFFTYLSLYFDLIRSPIEYGLIYLLQNYELAHSVLDKTLRKYSICCIEEKGLKEAVKLYLNSFKKYRNPNHIHFIDVLLSGSIDRV